MTDSTTLAAPRNTEEQLVGRWSDRKLTAMAAAIRAEQHRRKQVRETDADGWHTKALRPKDGDAIEIRTCDGSVYPARGHRVGGCATEPDRRWIQWHLITAWRPANAPREVRETR